MFEAYRALGHINYAAVKHAIVSGKVLRIAIDHMSEPVFCDACA